jgi:exodeoxyribonuclease VII large subunit
MIDSTALAQNPMSVLPTKEESVFFSPSSIVAIFNAATVTKEEKKIIQIRGIYQKKGTVLYGGNYYDRLQDEAGENSITLIVSTLLHNQLEDNKTIEINGFITRRLDKQGRIDIFINMIELLTQRVNKFSEEDTKKILLINKKVELGFKDLDSHIKTSVFNNKRLSIKVIMGKSGIIDSDIKKAMESSMALYDIEYHRVSLTAPEEILSKINMLDVPGTDIICLARGGGENLKIFDNLDICECILNRNAIIASAIGHAEDVSLFEKLADKKFITPTQFGNYLKEIYNSTVEELAKSKAKLVHDLTTQFTANYGKQIQNLNEQLKASKELHEKTMADVNKNNAGQLEVLTVKLKSFEELANKTSREKQDLHLNEVTILKKQIGDLILNHQTQLDKLSSIQAERAQLVQDKIKILEEQESQKDKMIRQANELASSYKNELEISRSKSGVNIWAVIIAVITGIIIGLLINGIG